MKNKILIFDIENSPNLSYVWGRYEQNVIADEREWNMLSFAYRWLGDRKVKAFSLPDFPGYKKDRNNDTALIMELWNLLDEADIVIGHNVDRFDVRKTNARFLSAGLTPPSPYKTVDTYKLAKKYFFLNSNKLTDLATYLGVGKKVETGGFDLWLGCMSGDKKSWKKMVEYNKHDVELTEKVYLKLRPWMNTSPNQNLYQGTTHSCPICGQDSLQKRGWAYTRVNKYQRYQCVGDKGCGGWSTGERIEIDKVTVK